MEERDLVKELNRLQQQPPTVDDWRDLYETIEGYKQRCLARAIARSPQRTEILATIRALAGIEP